LIWSGRSKPDASTETEAKAFEPKATDSSTATPVYALNRKNGSQTQPEALPDKDDASPTPERRALKE